MTEFAQSLETAAYALEIHVAGGPVVGASWSESRPWLTRMDTLFDSRTELSQRLFSDKQALILFFQGLAALAISELIDEGYPEEDFMPHLNDLGGMVLTAVTDFRDKHLTPIGNARRTGLLFMVQGDKLFDPYDKGNA